MVVEHTASENFKAEVQSMLTDILGKQRKIEDKKSKYQVLIVISISFSCFIATSPRIFDAQV